MEATTLPPKPDYTPVHPKFIGKAKVLSVPAHLAKKIDGPSYEVDLGAGTCTCKNGAPWEWHNKNRKWVPHQACSHKIRMMADILEREGRPTDMQIAYSKQVAMRYNMYEAVSAFHKELRRGNIEHAVFWGHVLAYFRRTEGVTKYLLNILFEETREYWLGEWLLGRYTGDHDSYETMLLGIALFCKAPKKWDLPHRLQILLDEMRGYHALVKKYGRDVAKGGDIIALSERDKLMAMLKAALKSKGAKTGSHLENFQYALKGLQKSKCANIDAHRAWILNAIMETVNVGKDGARLSEYIQSRHDAGLGIGYHELNAFADLAMGEKYPRGWIMPDWAKTQMAFGLPKLRLGVVPTIPIYAQDNHTWAGKALIKQYPNEWQAGAKQEHYDLRLCGAYMGVVWRHLAMKQHNEINCEWSEVEWPKWLHETVSNLWY